mgnify:CR=1 FL=1
MRYEPQHDNVPYICWGSQVHPQPTISIIPYAAPSTGGFVGNSPKGCGRDAARCQRDRMSLLIYPRMGATPDKCEKRRKQAASGSPFLWILSFTEKRSCIFCIHHVHVAWRSKRKKLAFGCENPIKSSVAAATQQLIPIRKKLDDA